MSLDLKTFQRFMPALQHLARFPGCNRAAICKRHNFALEDVEAFMALAAGSIALWDEDALAATAAGFKLKVGAYSPAKPLFKTEPPAPLSAPRAAKPLVVSARKILVAPPAVAAPPREKASPPPVPKASAAGRKSNQRHTAETYRPVLSDLVVDPALSESKACAARGILQGNFSYWKIRTFGQGATRAMFAEHLNVPPPPASDAPSAMRIQPAPVDRKSNRVRAQLAVAAPTIPRASEEILTFEISVRLIRAGKVGAE